MSESELLIDVKISLLLHEIHKKQYYHCIRYRLHKAQKVHFTENYQEIFFTIIISLSKS